MTKAEARQYIIDHCNPYYPQGDTKWDEAMNTAIKALEEPERKNGIWRHYEGVLTWTNVDFLCRGIMLTNLSITLRIITSAHVVALT